MGPAPTGSRRSALPPPRSALRAAAPRGSISTRTTLGGGVSDDATYCHAAAVVRSDAELVGTARTYVQAGLDAGDLVVVAGGPSVSRRLADEFGADDRVVFDDRIRLHDRRAPDVIAACLEASRRAADDGRRVRLLAQVDQPDDPRDVREFACFESAANLLSPVAPMSVLCLYDARYHSADLLQVAPTTHPFLVGPAGRQPSDAYADPREFVRSLPLPHEPLQDGAPVLAIDDAPTLAGLRQALRVELARVVPDRDQRDDLHLGLSEMAANAFRHGAPPVSARLWAGPSRLVCTITDRGRGIDPLAGYWPAHGDDLGLGGMGLWLARKLFDHVDLLRADGGTTVRLASALRRAA